MRTTRNALHLEKDEPSGRSHYQKVCLLIHESLSAFRARNELELAQEHNVGNERRDYDQNGNVWHVAVCAGDDNWQSKCEGETDCCNHSPSLSPAEVGPIQTGCLG